MKEDHFENDIFEEPKAKNKIPALLYLILALVVVAVATVGIFSISYGYDESVDTPSVAEVSLPVIVVPDPVSEPDFPVINDETGVDAEVSEEDKETFFVPVEGEVIRGYSMDALVFSPTMRDYRVHSGIDIKAEIGDEVVAFADGTVEEIKDDWYYGKVVAVKHALGLTSYYMCLGEIPEDIKVGSAVKAGDVVGRIGESRIEAADEPHLHFEMRVNGELIDPTEQLPQ